MRISYEQCQLDEVKEIVINNEVIEFTLIPYELKQTIKISDFCFYPGSDKIKIYFVKSDGRIETWFKVNNRSLPIHFKSDPEQNNKSYHLDNAYLLQKDIRSIYITELY